MAVTFCRNLQSFDKKWRTMVDKKEVPTVPKADVWPDVEPKAAETADPSSSVIIDTGGSQFSLTYKPLSV